MKVRKDILLKLFEIKNICEIIPDEATPSEIGFIYESVFIILVLCKCILIEWENILIGKYTKNSTLKPFKCAENILSESITNKSGGKSDLTLSFKDKFIVFSCKMWDKFSPGESDVERINNTILSRKEETSIGFICKNKSDIINHNIQDEDTNDIFKKIIENKLLFDLDDMNVGLCKFHKIFRGLNYNQICEKINNDCMSNPRKLLVEKLHQKMTLLKFIKNFKNGKKMHLIAHKTRSGKTITQLLIMKYLIENNVSTLFMTSVPSTLDEFIDDLEKYICFKQCYEIHKTLNKDNTDEICIRINKLVLCSTQFLKNDKNKIKKVFLKKNKFEAFVIDECHYTSSTSKTKNDILDSDIDDIRKNIKFNIFTSATPKKTKQFYNIPNDCVYNWQLYDESQMKLLHQSNYNDKEIINDMIIRHGDIFKQCLENSTLNKDYTNMPSNILLKAKYPDELVKSIENINLNSDTKFGLNCALLLSLQKNSNGKFIDTFDICKTVDGEEVLESYLDNIISNDKNKFSIMKQIEKTQEKYNSRRSNKNNPLMIIMYLPTHTKNGSIDMMQKALCKFIENKGLWKDYNIEYSNAINNSNIENESFIDEIKSYIIQAKKDKKRGCILLLGDKGNIGITYPDCDVTIHLDDGHNIEQQEQKRARAGTPANDKSIYINVDMDVQRSFITLFNIVTNYQVGSKKEWTYKEILKYLYENNIFLFDDGEFNNGIMTPLEIDNYFEKLSVNVSKCIKDDIMDYLCDKILYDSTNVELGKYIEEITNTSLNDIPNHDLQGEQQNLSKGDTIKTVIEKIIVENSNTEKDKEKILKQVIDLKKRVIDLMKSRRGIPFYALLSRWFNKNNLDTLISDNEILIKSVLENVIPNINKDYIFVLYKMTILELFDNNRDIVNQIFEIYINAKPSDYIKLVYKMFPPSSEDRDKHGEVTTGVNLSSDMAGVFNNFYHIMGEKYLEFCCGKGIFLLELFDRLYNSLDISDDNEKCRYIIEECLYFADINPLNVFICKVLLSAHACSYTGIWNNNYNYNCLVCDSLQLDTIEEWNIPLEKFNTISNPPYSTDPTSQSPKTIYHLFIEKYITSKRLLLVVPSRWFIGGKGLDNFRKMMMNRKDIKLIVHEDDETKWFGNSVQIKGGVNYFLIESGYNGLCNFNGFDVNLGKYDTIIKPEHSKLIDKLINNSKFKPINDIFNGGSTYKISTNDTRLHDVKEKDDILCYVSLKRNKKRINYLNKNEIKNDIASYDKWKVITPEAAHGAYSGFGEIFIGKPYEVCNQSYIFFEVNSENEAKSLQSYLNTKFVNHILSIRKNSQHISNKTCKWIPLVQLDQIWTDNKIKEYFSFTDNDVKLYNLIQNSDNENNLSKINLNKLTIPKIKKLMDDLNIKYKSNDKKQKLINLYEENQ